jgi:hypothetical protein
VNVAGLELTSTPLSIPSRSLGVESIPGLPGSELGAFLSLVTGFVEKIPAIAPSHVDAVPAMPSHPNGTAAPNKDREKNSTGSLHDLGSLGNANNLSKDAKNHERPESVALPLPVSPVQEPASAIASPTIVYEVARPGPLSRVESDQVTSNGNKSDGGAAHSSDPAPVPLASAIPGATAPGVDVAFALRLIPVVSEPKDASQAVLSSPQPVAVKFTSVPSQEPVQPNPNQASAITNEMPGAAPSTLKGSFFNPVLFRAGSDAKPLQTDEHLWSIPTAVRAGVDRLTEPTPDPLPVSSPAAVPQSTQEASAWSWPSLPKQNAEIVSAARPEPGLLSDQQFKSEPSTVAAPGPVDSAMRQPDLTAKTNGTLPVIAHSLPRPMTPGETGISQPESKEPRSEPTAKRELPAFQLNTRHAEGSAAGVEAPARPQDMPGTPVTRVDGSSSADLQVLKVASEPEIKVGIAPPPFRQISLKLSTDDSTRVNLDLIEKAGKVQVTVRTPDHELAKSLQTDLGDLIGRLESKGFKTESWIPPTIHQAATPAQSTNSNGGFNQPQHSGAGQGGGQQQRHQQNGSNQRQQARWTAQMEETLSADEARSESK